MAAKEIDGIILKNGFYLLELSFHFWILLLRSFSIKFNLIKSIPIETYGKVHGECHSGRSLEQNGAVCTTWR